MKELLGTSMPDGVKVKVASEIEIGDYLFPR